MNQLAQDSRPLANKVAIVTGASRGIGAAICENLAKKGANLVLNYTSESSAQRTDELASKLSADHNVKTVVVRADMGSEDGPAQIVRVAREIFVRGESGMHIDIIVNNAGVSGNRTLEECNVDEFARQYNVNVRGPMLLVGAARRCLPTDRSGRIVNISSVSSSLGFVGQTIYGGTKAALEAMTRTWARELAESATVNAVNPGPVATDMYAGVGEAFVESMRPFLENTPLAALRKDTDPAEAIEDAKRTGGRPAHEHEIAGLVGLLCMPEAGFTTGSVLCANGGMTFTT